MENIGNFDDQYYVIKPLSVGGVYLVQNNKDKKEYVARIIKKNNNGLDKELQMALKASNLNNPNIVHLYHNGIGTLTLNGKVHNDTHYLIMDYCPKKDLFRYIKNKKLFSEKHAKLIFKKILNGFKALHEAGICHRNLKLENILLDQNFNPKISDFSFSTIFIENNAKVLLNEQVGTTNNKAPEINDNRSYNGDKADVFSLGCILFNLVTGQNGFLKAKENDNYYKFIRNEQINEYWESLPNEIKNNNFSPQFKNLYISMVSFQEKNRPTVDQILQDNWFNELLNLNDQQLEELEKEVRNEFLQKE